MLFLKTKKENFSLGVIRSEQQPSVVEFERIKRYLKKYNHISLTEGSIIEIEEKLKHNKIVLALTWNSGALVFKYDKTNPEASKARFAIDHLLQKNFGRKDVIKTKEMTYTPPGSRYIDFLIQVLLL